MIGQDGVANFTNCMFDGNSGSAGGAILADVGTTLTVDKCTFTNNKVRTEQNVFLWPRRCRLSLQDMTHVGDQTLHEPSEPMLDVLETLNICISLVMCCIAELAIPWSSAADTHIAGSPGVCLQPPA